MINVCAMCKQPVYHTKVLTLINILDLGKSTTFTKRSNSQLFTVLLQPELQIKETIKQINCGNDHCLALTFSGRIFSWGIGRYVR